MYTEYTGEIFCTTVSRQLQWLSLYIEKSVTCFFFWLPPTEYSSAVYLWQENRLGEKIHNIRTNPHYKKILRKFPWPIVRSPDQNLSDREISGK
jgi:hypothetical protein